MVDSKENYKFDLGVKGLSTLQSISLLTSEPNSQFPPTLLEISNLPP